MHAKVKESEVEGWMVQLADEKRMKERKAEVKNKKK